MSTRCVITCRCARSGAANEGSRFCGGASLPDMQRRAVLTLEVTFPSPSSHTFLHLGSPSPLPHAEHAVLPTTLTPPFAAPVQQPRRCSEAAFSVSPPASSSRCPECRLFCIRDSGSSLGLALPASPAVPPTLLSASAASCPH